MLFFNFYVSTIFVSLVLALICLYYINKCTNFYKSYYIIHKNDEDFYIKRAILHEKVNVVNNPIIHLDVTFLNFDKLDNEYNEKHSTRSVFTVFGIISFIPIVNILILMAFTTRLIYIDKVINEVLI